MRRRSEELFRDLGVHIDVNRHAGDLSIAQQQLIEIAKAVSQNAKLLIMDEPSAAIAQAEVENMMKIVLRLKERGVTIIYISHRMNEIFQLADTATVLRDGAFVDARPLSKLSRQRAHPPHGGTGTLREFSISVSHTGRASA